MITQTDNIHPILRSIAFVSRAFYRKLPKIAMEKSGPDKPMGVNHFDMCGMRIFQTAFLPMEVGGEVIVGLVYDTEGKMRCIIEEKRK